MVLGEAEAIRTLENLQPDEAQSNAFQAVVEASKAGDHVSKKWGRFFLIALFF